MYTNRRHFIRQMGMGMGSLFLPASPFPDKKDGLHFGVIADVHQDIMYDATPRLEAFMQACSDRQLDFIVQMGDFCFPIEKNRPFCNLFNSYTVPKYHVLGNHDMDVSSKAQTRDFWEISANHYSFEHKGIRFLVLDANFLYRDGKYTDYEKGNFYVDGSYTTFVHPDQIDWLAEELDRHRQPTFILSHQGLAHDWYGIKNRLHIQHVVEEANRRAGHTQVLACLNGHNHIDFVRTINDIHYVDINSASYSWLGEAYKNLGRYESKIYETHPAMAYIAPYKDPLFTFIHLHPSGWIEIEGMESNWVGPSPKESGVPSYMFGMEPRPEISYKKLK